MNAPRYFGPTLLVLGVYVAHACRFWHVLDDAFISFRYSRHVASGLGFRFNPGDPPVEGFSNLLWVLVGSLVELVGLSQDVWLPLLSVVCGAVLVYRVMRVAEGPGVRIPAPFSWVAGAFLALFPPFAVWSTSGLETMPFALAIFLCFEQLFVKTGARPPVLFLLGGALLTLRPEGFAWGVGLGLVACMRKEGRRTALLFLGTVFAVFAALTLWRLSYFGMPFPNTVYAKGQISPYTLRRGFNYCVVFVLHFLPCLLLVPATFLALRSSSHVLRYAVVVAWAPFAYATAVGGDFMAMGRFLVPAFPFIALLVTWVVCRLRVGWRVPLLACILVLNLLPGLDLVLVPASWLKRFDFRLSHAMPPSEFQQWDGLVRDTSKLKALGLALKSMSRPGQSVVLGPIGYVGYYSELHVYDRFGLVNVEVAHRPRTQKRTLPGHDAGVPNDFFSKYEPTYLHVALVNREERARRLSEAWQRKYGPLGYDARTRELGEEGLLVYAESRAAAAHPGERRGEPRGK